MRPGGNMEKTQCTLRVSMCLLATPAPPRHKRGQQVTCSRPATMHTLRLPMQPTSPKPRQHTPRLDDTFGGVKSGLCGVCGRGRAQTACATKAGRYGLLARLVAPNICARPWHAHPQLERMSPKKPRPAWPPPEGTNYSSETSKLVFPPRRCAVLMQLRSHVYRW